MVIQTIGRSIEIKDFQAMTMLARAASLYGDSEILSGPLLGRIKDDRIIVDGFPDNEKSAIFLMTSTSGPSIKPLHWLGCWFITSDEEAFLPSNTEFTIPNQVFKSTEHAKGAFALVFGLKVIRAYWFDRVDDGSFRQDKN